MVQGRAFHFIREIASGGFGSVYLAEVARPDGSNKRVRSMLIFPPCCLMTNPCRLVTQAFVSRLGIFRMQLSPSNALCPPPLTRF